MHLKRLFVAILLLPLLYLYIMYLPQQYFFFLIISVSFIAMMEFYSMYRVYGLLRYLSLILGISLVTVAYHAPDLLTKILGLSVMALLAARLIVKKTPLSSLNDIAGPLVGLLYIPLFLSFHIRLRNFGPEWIIFLFATVWAADSMAYYIGKGLGKKKLFPEVSPNKTVAGAVGSLLGGAAGALLLKILLVQQLTLPKAAFIGIMIGVISIIGDLVESMFKRDAGVKDSSVIIPGHGGILDKIDGSLFAGPLLYAILKIFGMIQ